MVIKVLLGMLSFWGLIGAMIYGISKIPPEVCRAMFPYGLGFMAVLIFFPFYMFIGEEIKDYFGW